MTAEESTATEENENKQEQGAGVGHSIDDLDRSLANAPKYQRTALIKEHIARMIGGTSDWLGELTMRAVRHNLDLPELRSLVADLAWLSREVGEDYPREGEPTPPVAAPSEDLYRLVVAYASGQRLRFDFKFDSLNSAVRGWLNQFEDDALILSFAAFSSLALRAPHALELYRQAVASPNADRRSRHVCLAGIWLAHHVDGQPEMLLELSNQMLAKGEVDENVFYRRASAFRKLHQYDQALQEIDHAITLLGPGNNVIHQDYMRERELIIVAMHMQQHAESLSERIGKDVLAGVESRIEEASAKLGARVESAQRVVSESLLKIVEILGLFVTLAGFLIGSGVVVFNSTKFSERAAAMIIVMIGSLLFFVLLRLVTSFKRK